MSTENITTTETKPRTFAIPLSAWGAFTAKLAKLNKRAAKLGCEPITFTIVSEAPIERIFGYGVDGGEIVEKIVKIPGRTIVLHGSAPKLGGFEFLARIEYLSDGASMLFHSVPGTEGRVDPRFRSLTSATCEHCNKARRRTDAFVVRHVETGVQTQVGRQCLADFTGINTPEKLAANAAWLRAFDDLDAETERYWRGHMVNMVDTVWMLALTSAYIEKEGWVPRSANLGYSTASLVANHFWTSKDSKVERDKRVMEDLAREPKHAERAAKVVEWIKTELSVTAKSDYEMNLVVLTVNDLTEQKHVGLVASAVAAYQRAMNQKVDYAKRREAAKSSVHVGKVGERLRNVSGRVEMIKPLEAGQFGARTLVKLASDDGNIFTWFASGDREFRRDAPVTFTGTVKKHTEYNGAKETQLSRVIVGDAAPEGK